MRVLDFLDYIDVVKFDIEVLVHRLESSPYLDIILQLNGHLVVHQGLEEAVERQLSSPVLLYQQTNLKNSIPALGVV
jgi:hypothetical protein